MHGEKEGEKREKNNNNNTFWKERGGKNVSEQRDKGWIHVIRVHDTTHLAVTKHGRATDAHELPHTKKEWEVSLNIETTPLTRTP